MFAGNDPETTSVRLQGRKGTCEIVTTSEVSPKPETKVCNPIDVNISWLLERVVAPTEKAKAKAGGTVLDLVVSFEIDRTKKSCHTPRRNTEVDTALRFFRVLAVWAGQVNAYFRNNVFPTQSLDKLDMAAINDSGVFVPVAPLMLPGGADEKGVVLPVLDERALIAQQRRTLEAKLSAL